jgi:signal transduction histidine kinase
MNEQHPSSRSRQREEADASQAGRIRLLTSAATVAVAFGVLAGVVILTTLQIRQRIREQIASRDGEVLHAVALLHYAQDVETGLTGPITTPGDQLSVVLNSGRLRGVLGVRLFGPDGQFVESFPPSVTEQVVAEEGVDRLKELRPISRFHPRAQMAELFYPDEAAPTGTIPMLDVFVPLHTEGGPLAGIAQFLVEGHSIATEYARLDRNLAWQAFVAFGAGGTILSAALVWAFRRIQRSQQLLSERTQNLVKANQELALAAKTSALGAVTAHLIHGLKNPLAGLESFVSSRGASSETDAAADLQQAVASTRRMQTMINQVIGVLREEEAGAQYEITPVELEQIVRARVQPLARERGVNFASAIHAQGALPNRVANLVALILVNLAENAVQATPGGKSVNLIVRQNGTRLVFEVGDEGTGFPADMPLFMPCSSSKQGGTGIGLALCKQLANHLGANLELASSVDTGCTFALSLPEPVDATEFKREQGRMTKSE